MKRDIFVLNESATDSEKVETAVVIAAMHMVKCYAQIYKFTNSWADSIYSNLLKAREILSSKNNKKLVNKLFQEDIIANNEDDIKKVAAKETKLTDLEISNAYNIFRSKFNTYDFVYKPEVVKTTIDYLIINSNMQEIYTKEALYANEVAYR